MPIYDLFLQDFLLNDFLDFFITFLVLFFFPPPKNEEKVVGLFTFASNILGKAIIIIYYL